MITSKIIKRVALNLGVAAVTLSGCATTEEGLSQRGNQWLGKDIGALTKLWGTTENKTTLSDGSELWVYRKTKEATINDQAPTRTTRKERTEAIVVNGETVTRQVQYDETSYDPSAIRTLNCEARFIIKDGVVRSAVFKGQGCD